MPARVLTASRLNRSGVAEIQEIQRSRLLAAMVSVVDERGYQETSVAHITRRTKVSRRTFYDLFANREECFGAVIDDVLRQIQGELTAANLEGLLWRERVRTGLWAILSFFDREPALARVCIVQSVHGGPAVSARRERILARLAAVVDEGRGERRAARCTPLAAEGVVGAAFMILSARLERRERGPLLGLLGELVGIVVLPYLGPGAANRERSRPAPAPLAGVTRKQAAAARAEADPLASVPMRLTYRTAQALEVIARYPGSCNREIAERAGVHDPGQISKLLARLERLELLMNSSAGHAKGEPNAWALTARGKRVVQAIRSHSTYQQQRRAA